MGEVIRGLAGQERVSVGGESDRLGATSICGRWVLEMERSREVKSIEEFSARPLTSFAERMFWGRGGVGADFCVMNPERIVEEAAML